MNTILSFGLLLIVLVGGIVLTGPDIPLVPMLVICLAVAGLSPIVLFPFSKTIWTAIDLLMRPIELDEVDPDYLPPGR